MMTAAACRPVADIVWSGENKKGRASCGHAEVVDASDNEADCH